MFKPKKKKAYSIKKETVNSINRSYAQRSRVNKTIELGVWNRINMFFPISERKKLGIIKESSRKLDCSTG